MTRMAALSIRVCILLAQYVTIVTTSSTGRNLVDAVTLAQPISEQCDISSEADLLFDPPNGSMLNMNSKRNVYINISTSFSDCITSNNGSRYFMGVLYDTDDLHLVNMIKVVPIIEVMYERARRHGLEYHLFWEIQPDNRLNNIELLKPTDDDTFFSSNAFEILIDSIGYPKIEIEVIKFDSNNKSEVLSSHPYQLKITRRSRKVDLGFTIALTIVGAMNTFAIGSVTDTAVLKSQLKESIIPVCISSGTQYIALPLLTFGLLKAASILPELGVGILLCSCVPGGGLGYLIVVVTGTANTELSVTINFLHMVATLISAPLWLFSLSQSLKNGAGTIEIPTHYVIICLVIMLAPYTLGIITRHFKPNVSEALLNWLVKPILLLFMILFVTLGLYINIYALTVLDELTLIVAGTIPSLGYCIGGGLTLLAKQGKPSAKTVAIEAAIMNCLAVIVAAKFTMPQPDSDMAVAGAMAIIFCTPVPFAALLIFHKVKKKITTYLENRRFEREQQETILKSFAVITQNALQISGMTPAQVAERKLGTPNIDNTLSDCYEGTEGEVPYVAQLQKDSTVETVPLTQSNHRNYL